MNLDESQRKTVAEWIAQGLKRVPPVPPRTGKKYPYIDTW